MNLKQEIANAYTGIGLVENTRGNFEISLNNLQKEIELNQTLENKQAEK